MPQSRVLFNGRPNTLMARWHLALLTCLSAALGVLMYGWFIFMSPWGHQPPDGYPAVDNSQKHQVFVYGTLRFSVVRWLVIGENPAHRPAVLPGFRKEGLDIVADPGNRVKGLAFMVDADELRRLDRYERIGIRYGRAKYRLQDGSRAWVYRRLPESDGTVPDISFWESR